VDRQPADVVTGEFDLPGVAPGADAQAELADGCGQRLCAARTARRWHGPEDVASPLPLCGLRRVTMAVMPMSLVQQLADSLGMYVDIVNADVGRAAATVMARRVVAENPRRR
jgi:hypothetical protein